MSTDTNCTDEREHEHELMERTKRTPKAAYTIKRLAKILDATYVERKGDSASMILPPRTERGVRYSATLLDVYVRGTEIEITRRIPENKMAQLEIFFKMGYKVKLPN